MAEVTATTCTNGCGRPATTTWGFPVCQKCHDGLEYLHRTLNEDAGVEPDSVLVDLFNRPSRIRRDDENDRSTDA